MNWRDSLRPASFRGVAFYVEGHEAGFGRRQVTHEFAQRDEPLTEDLGRKARDYSVEAYLLGDDYPAQKQKLIDACETGGSGELVHPYFGNLKVVCTGLKVTETSGEGRICKLQMTFIEAGEARYPTDATDATRAVTGAANAVQDAARAGFLQGFLADGFPSFVVDAAQQQLAGLSGLLSGLPVNPLAEAQAVADFFDRVGGLAADALALITSPGDLADRVLGIVGSVRDVFGSRADSVLQALVDGNSARYGGPADTANRRQQQANTDAMSALVRRAAVAERAKVAVLRAQESADAIKAPTGATTPGLFQTREDAIAARDALTDAIDAEMEHPATSDAEFTALSGLRAELVRGVPSPGLQLPRVAEVTPAATLPSLVVSYQVYGSAGRAVEIAERNRARHPGFLPGGAPLQVIADG